MNYRTCINNKFGHISRLPDQVSKNVYNLLINIHIYNLKLVDELLNYLINFVNLNKNNYIIIPTVVVDTNFDYMEEQKTDFNRNEFYDKIKSNIMCDNNLVIKYLDKIYHLTKKFNIFENINVIFVFTPNKGADIGGLMKSLDYAHKNNIKFDAYAHIHTKTSDIWRNKMMNIFKHKNINYLLDNYDLIGTCAYAAKYGDKDKNCHYVKYFCDKYNIKLLSEWFLAGTIFICKKTDNLMNVMANADIIYNELNDITIVDEYWKATTKNIKYNNNFHAQSEGKNILADAMKEHAFERIISMIFDRQIYVPLI